MLEVAILPIYAIFLLDFGTGMFCFSFYHLFVRKDAQTLRMVNVEHNNKQPNKRQRVNLLIVWVLFNIADILFTEFVCDLNIVILMCTSWRWCDLTIWVTREQLGSHVGFFDRVHVAHLYNFLCYVFSFVCRRSVSFAQCCLYLWIVHSWLLL